MEHEEKLPEVHAICDEPLDRRVVDYVAGMTDQYALRMAGELGLIGI